MASEYNDGRPVWRITAPPGGWASPWPQLVEIVGAVPHTQWTLIGGVMVQLHAAYAGMQLTRPTRDIDMILHIETGAATFSGVREQLERLGYAIHEPGGDGPVHRFYRGARGDEQVDVMVADHLAPSMQPTVMRRPVFGVPGGTSALRKTVNCEVDTGGSLVVLSIPDTLGALVLKGAAYEEDSRDRERHLDDAAVLACTMNNPVTERERMGGSDPRRVRGLWKVLSDLNHKSWNIVGDRAGRGHAALRVLCE
ncbi:hypothetical protein ABFW00_08965 [Mycobacteroides abscessus]|uniref:hypothetical protein n=1 Tax=Mycobacteroides abscessus TaxID=36809 RepID=UPI0009D4F370|nr:hypothetical protein [Mycobacteroides abscessus]SKF26685.1 Uncharacterised protein [Mycobacteroides abscessus subsp. abscessus]SKR35078.1 Uncharacterised protein [Mycobacteroides abscessus subsp. abscessus]